ncbi:pseudouridine synthase [Microbulbifer guangxiensis]|uniref:pseudouridine synthase n=1 Tax=Microbulbifer guangxiensis TaxID=2904249 RepID=UPI001F00F4F1|nr:pseudouridine synthase [Microbulbifer guangxiensis]
MTSADDQPELRPEVIYRDDHLIGAYKPEGWLVHRSSIDRHETQFLLQYLRDETGSYLYPIHRLDKPTSGVILFARSSEVAAKAQALLESDVSVKKYIAVCRGYCPEEGVIDHPLPPVNDFKHQRRRPRADQPRQEAITLFRRLDTIELPFEVDRYPSSRYSLVEIQLKTGRRHQIRRHFKHISHPLIGCPKYGKSIHNRFFAEHFGCSRLLLHAIELRLPHPVTGAPLALREPPRGDFRALLEAFGWQV